MGALPDEHSSRCAQTGRYARRMDGPVQLFAVIALVSLPTVMFGGFSLLRLRIAGKLDDFQITYFRAGHAHAGVLLLLSLIALRYVDETSLSERVRWLVRLALPAAAVLLPLAFFLSVLTPDATEPNPLINLAYLGAVLLVTAMLTLGIGLIRARATVGPDHRQISHSE
jgi:Ni,Fe-hydrogenase I cytochrome b subunit